VQEANSIRKSFKLHFYFWDTRRKSWHTKETKDYLGPKALSPSRLCRREEPIVTHPNQSILRFGQTEREGGEKEEEEEVGGGGGGGRGEEGKRREEQALGR
jgi:hypothetical protein